MECYYTILLYYGKGEPGQEVVGGFNYPPQHSEIVFQAPVRSPKDDSTRATDLKSKLMTNMNTWRPQKKDSKAYGRMPLEALLDDVHVPLQTIPILIITEINKL